MAAAIGIAKTATEIFLGVGQVSIDNFTFRLFYKWSVTLFIVCSVLVCTSQFFGDPVQCETAEDSVDDDVLNSFCWMYTSFDTPPAFTSPCTRKKYDGTFLYNTYYQWVSIFLGFLAVVYYIPRCVWIMLEGNLMEILVKGTVGMSPPKDMNKKKGEMLKHFQEHVHNKFNRYAFGFFLCEFCNLLFAVICIYLTHIFLNYQFYDYGILVYQYFMLPPEERQRPEVINPMCEVFPKVAACNYHRYGMGGRVDGRNAICILGLNMINDKVFVLVWVWHCLLVVMGCVRVFTRSLQLCSARIRMFLVQMKMQRYFAKNAHMVHIRHYILHCSIGDWFVLYQMSKNVNKRFFAEFLALLALTVDPDPDEEPDDPEICLKQEELEQYKNGVMPKSDANSSRSASSDDEDSKGKGGIFANAEDNLDCDITGDGGAASLSGKQRMLIKQGKTAMSAKHKAAKAVQQMRKMKRK